MRSFLRHPQSHPVRRALFQVHLWIGLATGLYLLVVCLSGAALLFRIDWQRFTQPQLFISSQSGEIAEPVAVLESVRTAYPESRLVGIDAPTTSRPSYLAYVTQADAFHTVLLHPETAAVLGELADDSLVRWLQDLHFSLLAGETGERINGVGALCLLTLCMTGLAIWWQGRGRWKRGLRISLRAGWRRTLWELHSAVGIWAWLFVAMWSVTALHFVFPSQFRAMVAAVSALTVAQTPKSVPRDSTSPPPWSAVIEAARAAMPGQYAARVVLPAQAEDPYQVLFSRERPTPVGSRQLQAVYIDQYTGSVLSAPRPVRTVGDAIVSWMAPLHVGSIGGPGLKILWALLALAPPLLFVTGAITWWHRVLQPALDRDRTPH